MPRISWKEWAICYMKDVRNLRRILKASWNWTPRLVTLSQSFKLHLMERLDLVKLILKQQMEKLQEFRKLLTMLLEKCVIIFNKCLKIKKNLTQWKTEVEPLDQLQKSSRLVVQDLRKSRDSVDTEPIWFFLLWLQVSSFWCTWFLENDDEEFIKSKPLLFSSYY